MKIQCPFCDQKYDVDKEYLDKEVECASCKQTFIINMLTIVQERNIEKSNKNNVLCKTSNSDKNKIVQLNKNKTKIKYIVYSIIVLFVVVIIGCILYKSINNLNAFERAYAKRLKDIVRDPESLKIDWKVSCVDSTKHHFLGICVVRAKNAMGGYAEPEMMKVVGIKIYNQTNAYDFKQVLIKVNPFISYSKVSYGDFMAMEQKEHDVFVRKVIDDLTSDLLEMQHLLSKIKAPVFLLSEDDKIIKGEEFDNYKKDYARLQDLYNKSLAKPLSDPSVFFRSIVLNKFPASDNNVEKIKEQIYKISNGAKKRYENIDSEIEEKYNVMIETRKRERDEFRQQLDKMINDACIVYKHNHGMNPSKELIEKYEDVTLDALYSVAIELDQIKTLQLKSKQLTGKTLTTSQKSELENIQNDLLKAQNKYVYSYECLLSPMYCHVLSGSCIKCKKARFNKSHIAFNFELSDFAKKIANFHVYISKKRKIKY